MRILVLSTWFPFPLSQGSKIRAYSLIKSLAEEHDVALLSFAEDEVQPGWIETLQAFCQRVEVVRHNPFQGNRARLLMNLFSLAPSSFLAGYSIEMERRTLELSAAWKPDLIFSFTQITAPYALKVVGIPKVVDIDNILTRYLREVYEQPSGLSKRLRRWMAWWKMRRYERELFKQFNLCLVVSERDRVEAGRLLQLPLDRVSVTPNGIDPFRCRSGLYEPHPGSMVFNGSLTYEPNLDAMTYFLDEIFPRIREKVAGAKITITGRLDGNLPKTIQSTEEVTLTGFVDDVYPIVGGSWACVAPLRKGAGTRLKILEAMALGTPVITTTKGAEGLDAEPGRHILIADTADAFVEKTVELLCNPQLRRHLASEAALWVQNRYAWPKIGQKLRNDLASLYTTSAQEVHP